MTYRKDRVLGVTLAAKLLYTTHVCTHIDQVCGTGNGEIYIIVLADDYLNNEMAINTPNATIVE